MRRIKNIFKEKELSKKSVVKDSLTTANDGKAYKTGYYNLDAIIVAKHFPNGVEFKELAKLQTWKKVKNESGYFQIGNNH